MRISLAARGLDVLCRGKRFADIAELSAVRNVVLDCCRKQHRLLPQNSNFDAKSKKKLAFAWPAAVHQQLARA